MFAEASPLLLKTLSPKVAHANREFWVWPDEVFGTWSTIGTEIKISNDLICLLRLRLSYSKLCRQKSPTRTVNFGFGRTNSSARGPQSERKSKSAMINMFAEASPLLFKTLSPNAAHTNHGFGVWPDEVFRAWSTIGTEIKITQSERKSKSLRLNDTDCNLSAKSSPPTERQASNQPPDLLKNNAGRRPASQQSWKRESLRSSRRHNTCCRTRQHQKQPSTPEQPTDKEAGLQPITSPVKKECRPKAGWSAKLEEGWLEQQQPTQHLLHIKTTPKAALHPGAAHQQ